MPVPEPSQTLIGFVPAVIVPVAVVLGGLGGVAVFVLVVAALVFACGLFA